MSRIFVLIPLGPAVFWVLACLGHHSVCDTDYLRLGDWLSGCSGEVRALVESLNEALEWLLSVVGRLESFIVCHHV